MSKLPWRVINASGQICVTDSAPVTEDYVSGNADPFLIVCHGVTDGEAHLIAAAPDLLEALQSLVDRYCQLIDSGDCGFWEPREEREIISANTAIAKAKGEDQ